MLSKEHKIIRKKDFEGIFRRGIGFREGFLTLRVKQNSSQFSRFAFVVSRKVSKKATVRNKIRRRLRGLIKIQINKITKGVDCVFIALPGLEKKNSGELKNILSSLLGKAGLIKE